MHAFRREIIQDMATLRRKHDPVTPIGLCPTEQRFVVTISVHIGRIKELDAQLDCFTISRYRFVLVATRLRIAPAHAHTTQPDHTDHGTIFTSRTLRICQHLPSVHFKRPFSVQILRPRTLLGGDRSANRVPPGSACCGVGREYPCTGLETITP